VARFGGSLFGKRRGPPSGDAPPGGDPPVRPGGWRDRLFRKARAKPGAEPPGAAEPVAAEAGRGGLLTRLRGRKGGQDAQLFFDPDLPDPAAEPDVDYVIDAKGRLSGGRRKLAIGLDWQPRQPEKQLTAQAREGVLEGMAVPRYAAVFADGSQVGFAGRDEGARGGMPAAATAVPMHVTGDSWVGAFRLVAEDDEGGTAWWLVAIRDGMVYEDRLIRDGAEARDAFEDLLDAPGWKARICPEDWDFPETVDLPLGLVLPRRSRGAVLRLHDPKLIWLPRAAVALVLAGIVGGTLYYQSYVEEQQRRAEIARRMAEEAARRAALNVAPWVDTPTLETFIDACTAGMDEVLVLPPGWRIDGLACRPGDRAVTVEARWRRDSGGRAAWFLAAMAESGLGDAALAPALEQATLVRTIPVPVAERRGEQPLPPGEMERRLRLRLDTLSLEATLRAGGARSAPRTAAQQPGTSRTSHEFRIATSAWPQGHAGLLADIPGVVADELVYDPYNASWSLTALIYHPPNGRH